MKLPLAQAHALVKMIICGAVFGAVYVFAAYALGAVTDAEKMEFRATLSRFRHEGVAPGKVTRDRRNNRLSESLKGTQQPTIKPPHPTSPRALINRRAKRPTPIGQAAKRVSRSRPAPDCFSTAERRDRTPNR